MRKGVLTKQKNLFSVTSKNTPKDAEVKSHQLMLKAGIVSSSAAGIYQYLPLGISSLEKIKQIIKEEMNEINAQEILLSSLQPSELWEKTGRADNYGKELMSVSDRNERKFILGPTHEEVITSLAKNIITSYKALPVSVFQIQTKFRDELRPRFGLLRAREFMMKDAYSFHDSLESLDKTYKEMKNAYIRILKRLDLDFKIVEADAGAIGGIGESHEFMVLSSIGEDDIVACTSCEYAANKEVVKKELSACPACKKDTLFVTKGIEVGHIFKLGDKYSEKLEAKFLNKDQKQENLMMGCYGIGVSRLLSAFIETNSDEKGIVWSKETTPYHVHVFAVHAKDEKQKEAAKEVALMLQKEGFDVLLDDRDKNAGIKFTDSELIGIPLSIIIGKDNLDIKYRHNGFEEKGNTLKEIKEKVTQFYKES